MARTGIFGGTFNPPHLGHKRIAVEMKELAHLDRIIVIPDNVPPHKQSSDLLSGEIRIEMCKKTFYEPYFEVSDLEQKREGKSFTFYTLEQLKQQYPDDELFLIIGSDMTFTFDKWFRYKDILKMVTLCVMSRENEVESERLYDYIKNVLEISANDVIVSESTPFEASSTEIKKKIKNDENVEAYLEKSTLKYIKQNSYYL